MKIVTIIGARPQFIKASVVSKAIQETDGLEEVLIHTGQHFDANMSDVFFEDLKIPRPKYNLKIEGGSHGDMTGRMLIAVEEVLLKEKPDCVMVYGDTNSTLAGALAASKLHIKVIHVEAGLRSFNMKMPEEVNRIITDRLSSVLFCPSASAIKNLQHEGFENFKNIDVHNIGDVMKDSSYLFETVSKKPDAIDSDLTKFFLCTFHRAENTDDVERLNNIVNALNQIHADVAPVVIPLHPRTKKALEVNNIKLDVNIIEPVSYLEMIWLIKNSKTVLTDSGGLQKEAYFFDKPCVTMRDETEWVELVEAGVNVLTGANSNKIIDAINNCDEVKFDNVSLYGDGKASYEITSILSELAKEQ